VRGDQRTFCKQRISRLQKSRFINIRERQRRTCLSKLLRQGAADAGSRSRHYGYPGTYK
jgi:hypothetical protein